MASIEDFLSRQFPTPPKDEIGIGGFLFFARVSEKASYVADIPVHYVEDGSSINDHVIRQPEVLSIEGIVGDVYRRPKAVNRFTRRTQSEIGNILVYAPDRTQAQSQKISGLINDVADAIRKADAIISAGTQAIEYFGNQDTESKPLGEQFIDAMESVYYGNQLISVDMPYRRWDLMAITSLIVERDNTNTAISFSIELRKFRTRKLEVVQIDAAPNPSPGLNGQLESKSDKGVQTGTDTPTSILGSIAESFGL